MSYVYEDNEWKRAPETKPTPPRPPTRMQCQARIDDLYRTGAIDLPDWNDRMALLSKPTFTAYHKIMEIEIQP